QNDVCHAGVCAGTAVVCTASDQCHVAGTCNPTTGQCSNPAAPDGTTCLDDGNPCTTDTCTAGVCVHSAGNAGVLCRPAAGVCDLPETCDGVNSDCPPDAKASSCPLTYSCSCVAAVCGNGAFSGVHNDTYPDVSPENVVNEYGPKRIDLHTT